MYSPGAVPPRQYDHGAECGIALLSFEEKDEQILEIDKDIICRTIAQVGQKAYVDAIRENSDWVRQV